MSVSIQTHEMFSNFIVHILERLENQKVTREFVWLYVINWYFVSIIVLTYCEKKLF
jgi:hypothetical protein